LRVPGAPVLGSLTVLQKNALQSPRNLGLDALDVVNLRSMFGIHGPAEGSIEAPLTVLAELQRQGLVRHIGLSNVLNICARISPLPI
jgi:aryl-alcohol dehydrogenase-like predicted oxidoreductase